MDKYFTYDKIIYYFCRVRAKYAKQRSKKHLVHVLSHDPSLNYHKEDISEDECFLKEILPPRRKWKKLGKKHRYINSYQKINSIEYNAKSIFKTIKYYQKNYPEEPFVKNLNNFVAEIRRCIDSPNYKINKPKIYPRPKERVKDKVGEINTCRPISLFSLRDKIIISQTNKYLSSFFDDQFYPLSHAFRAPVAEKPLTTHHSSIQELINYRNRIKRNHLWVAECDMCKFYDSVSHTVILMQFNELIKRAKSSGKAIDERAVNIFYEYLNSYNFVEDVLPKNQDKEFWESHNIPNGHFGWVKDELINLKHYSNISGQRIGVPQGGALSGLIANIVLDYADTKVTENKDDNLLYVRFCDDMILIHPNKKVCAKSLENYKNALLALKLVPHDFKSESEFAQSKKTFWSSKSKRPYKWSADLKTNSSYPWIGFVGYELHFDGHIRVRKSSLKKELKKQNEVVNTIKRAIQNDNKRARNGTIIESAINRLNGMSVGRIQMWNHLKAKSEMCWVNGFKMLNENSHLKRQLLMLDKNKNHQIALLKKEVKKYKDPDLEEDNKSPNREIIYYGKPFSYYHQVLKKYHR